MDSYTRWLKKQLGLGRGVIWFIMCGMMSHKCYNIPNAPYDHVEPILGIYSNYSLNDTTVYPNDVLVHASNVGLDGDKNTGYYRRFDTLFDSVKF
jgi:hypothetical protein